jgi:hypothetical protein
MKILQTSLDWFEKHLKRLAVLKLSTEKFSIEIQQHLNAVRRKSGH